MGAKAKAIEQELAEFKAKVRAEALRVRRDEGWDRTSMLRTFTRLGLSETEPASAPAAPAETSIPREGDPTAGLSGDWYTQFVRSWCERSHRPSGFVCSRPRGHAGDTHVASNALRVLRVWETGSPADRG